MADEFTPRAHIEYWFPNSSSPDVLEISSPKDLCYNCVAWSVGINSHWVEPYLDLGVKVEPWAIWPNEEDRGSSIDIYVRMFRGEGFVKASKASYEPGFDKIVIYWHKATKSFTHVARQMEGGEWWSKLGKASDVKHKKPDTLGPVGSPAGYGEVWGYMKRPKGAASKETPLKRRIKAN
jgi:hypothetical protein